MEGLIPLLYKAMKDRRSSTAGGGGGGGGVRAGAYPGSEHGDDDDRFDAAAAAAVDLSDPEQRRRWLELEVRSPLRAASSSSSDGRRAQVGHGRNRSLEELAAEVGNSPGRRLGVALPKARSVRVFSCIGAGGAA